MPVFLRKNCSCYSSKFGKTLISREERTCRKYSEKSRNKPVHSPAVLFPNIVHSHSHWPAENEFREDRRKSNSVHHIHSFFGCLCYYFMPPGPHARVKACGRPQVGMNSFHAVLHVPLCECNLAQYAKPQQLF